MSTALFYASSTGNTEDVANKIIESLGNDIKSYDIANDGYDAISDYDKVILGVSTWGEGDLQDDWDDIWDDFCNIDFSNKTVALFGLGDQEGYADEFVDALGIMYEQVITAGGDVVGFTSTDGYEHDASKADINGEFVGLVIDEDNQDDLTQERIETWTNNIKASIL
mgnify:CR=1 FL=1